MYKNISPEFHVKIMAELERLLEKKADQKNWGKQNR